MKSAIVLLSGGMDSATVLATALNEGYSVVKALSVNYGQKHAIEQLSAKMIANHYDVPLEFISLPQIKNSGLTDSDLPFGRTLEQMTATGIAPSYVPARNTVLLSLAASIADGLGAEAIFYGAHKEDHVGYPDCRATYFEAMSLALQLGTKHEVRIEAPFIRSLKSDIVLAAHRLGVPLHLTHSCYQGHQPACGVCDTCTVRIDAFKRAGLIDPIEYAVHVDWTGCIQSAHWNYDLA